MLAALLEGPASLEELAGRLELDPWPTSRLLELLQQVGLVRHRGERWEPDAGLHELASAPGGLPGAAAMWRGITPALRGQGDAWSSDALSRRAEMYHRVVPGLDRMFEPGARELAAALPDPAPSQILDLGAGAGVWGLAVLDRFAEARLTAVDLPGVIEVLQARAGSRGLADRTETRAGDFFEVSLPEQQDLVILGNVLRILPAGRAETLIHRAARALSRGGRLVIVDVMEDGDPDIALRRAVYRLHLAMRSSSTGPYSAERITEWMRGAGLHGVDQHRLASAPMRETALIARAG